MKNTTNKWKHFVDETGKTYNTAIVDGYDFGDTLLEDVEFNLSIDETGILSIEVSKKDSDYFSELNEDYWYKSILESVILNKEAYIRVNKKTLTHVVLVEDSENVNTTKYFVNNYNDIINEFKKSYSVDITKGFNYVIFKEFEDDNEKPRLSDTDFHIRITPVDDSTFDLHISSALKIYLQPTDYYLLSEDIETYFTFNGSVALFLSMISKYENLNGLTLSEYSEKYDSESDEFTEELESVGVYTQPNTTQNTNMSALNVAIQQASGKTNITANPDILNDLGIENDVEDPDFALFTDKIEKLKSEIKSRFDEHTENLKSLNKIIDRNNYWEVFYCLELYTKMMDKFFAKEYLTHPKIRYEKIQTFLEEIGYKYEPYLKSISYKINTQEDVEAYEQEYLAKYLLGEFFSVSKKEEKSSKVDFKEIASNVTNESKNKLSDLLRKIESEEKAENIKNEIDVKNLSDFDKADLKGKIAIKYDDVIKKATEVDGEPEGLIWTYVDSLYNPLKTSLDDKNLLLNLLIVRRMLDFGVMKWEFDENRIKISNTEIDLKHTWWNEILSSSIEEELKWVKIVEKDLNLAFYQTFIFKLIKEADRVTYNNRALKMKNLLSETSEDITKESLLLDIVIKRTKEDSILFITPDMEKYFETEKTIHEELGNKGQIRYTGIWDKRHIFVINTDNIKGLSNFTNEILCVNKGNSYIVNPDKPIVYFNVIDNPFLERPIIKWFAGAEFDISMDKSLRMNVENNFLD